MDNELKILELADHYEKFKAGTSGAYLIINKRMNDHQCMFGFTELSGNEQEARELFASIETRARELGYSSIVGPVNYCSWMSYRWAISNYDLKLYPDCTNPPYYNDIIRRLGYEYLYTYRSAVVELDTPLYRIGKDIYDQKLGEGYEFRAFCGSECYGLAREIFDISKEAFKGSYLYCDIPFEYFEKIYLSWTRAVDMIMYVAYHNGKPVGYVMGYDSPYGDRFISKTSAVKKDYQKNKLYTALLYLGCEHVKSLGYTNMIYHFQCEQKDTFKRFDKDTESNEKRYAVYIKELT